MEQASSWFGFDLSGCGAVCAPAGTAEADHIALWCAGAEAGAMLRRTTDQAVILPPPPPPLPAAVQGPLLLMGVSS